MMTTTEREAWLLNRRKGIGASDAPAILGVSRWRSAYEVWLDKIGAVPLDHGMTPEMEWGLRHEPAIALAYQEAAGCELAAPKSIQNPKHPFMWASIDRISDKGRVVELKTSRSSDGWGDPGTDEVPEEYLVQVVQQLQVARDAMTDIDGEAGDIAVLVGLSDFRVYTVPFHEELAKTMIEVEAEFWEMVERRREPPPDWEHPAMPKLIEIIRRPDKHKTIFLPDETMDLAMEALLLTNQRKDREKQAEDLKEQEAILKAKLSIVMGDAAVGVLSNGYEVKRTLFRECEVKAHTRPARTQVDVKQSKG